MSLGERRTQGPQINKVRRGKSAEAAASAKQNSFLNLLLENSVQAVALSEDALPQIIERIQRLLNDQETSISGIIELVSTEPALVSQLMKVANSAALNPKAARIVNLRAAVLRIGLDLLSDILIAYAVKQLSAVRETSALQEKLNRLAQMAGFDKSHVLALRSTLEKLFEQL